METLSVFFFFFFLLGSDGCSWIWVLAVTVVESGSRALQYLGLDGEKSSIGLDVSKMQTWLLNC